MSLKKFFKKIVLQGEDIFCKDEHCVSVTNDTGIEYRVQGTDLDGNKILRSESNQFINNIGSNHLSTSDEEAMEWIKDYFDSLPQLAISLCHLIHNFQTSDYGLLQGSMYLLFLKSAPNYGSVLLFGYQGNGTIKIARNFNGSWTTFQAFKKEDSEV